MRQRRRLFAGELAILLASLVALAALEWLTPFAFFAVAVVSLFVVAELTGPTTLTPPWRLRLRRVLAAAAALLLLVVLTRNL